MELDVTAMGELLIDFAPRGENEMGYPVLEANPGGAPGNFLAALAAYGARTAMLGKVGDDAFGHLLRETMARAGIETTGIVMDPSVFTTLAFVTLSPEGDRSFSFARKPGADTCLTWEEVDRTLIDAARSQGRAGVILTCKEHMIPFYEKFGFCSQGLSQSVHGGAAWYDMLLTFARQPGKQG